jgi:hypothetical protein
MRGLHKAAPVGGFAAVLATLKTATALEMRPILTLDVARKIGWSRQRRVIGKAEWTAGGANPRFAVTRLSPEDAAPQRLYEEIYCARGDMESSQCECNCSCNARWRKRKQRWPPA